MQTWHLSRLVTHYAVSMRTGQAVRRAFCCKAQDQYRVRDAECEIGDAYLSGEAGAVPCAHNSLLDLSEHFVSLFDGLDTVIRPTIACEINTFIQQTYGVLQARVFVVPLRMPRVTKCHSGLFSERVVILFVAVRYGALCMLQRGSDVLIVLSTSGQNRAQYQEGCDYMTLKSAHAMTSMGGRLVM
jgi:hypothetical protein